jgi:hypothetical protein
VVRHIFTVYFAPSSTAENYVSFYKLFGTHEYFQNNNVIIPGGFNLPLISGPDHDLLNGGPCRMLVNFLHLYGLYSINIKNGNDKTLYYLLMFKTRFL